MIRIMTRVWFPGIVLHLVLAISNIGRRDFWYDEALSLAATKHLATTASHTGGNMVAYYGLLTPWSWISASPEWLRLPSLAATTVAIGVGTILVDRQAGAAAARLSGVFIACSYIAVRYSSEARSYGLLALLVASRMAHARQAAVWRCRTVDPNRLSGHGCPPAAGARAGGLPSRHDARFSGVGTTAGAPVSAARSPLPCRAGPRRRTLGHGWTRCRQLDPAAIGQEPGLVLPSAGSPLPHPCCRAVGDGRRWCLGHAPKPWKNRSGPIPTGLVRPLGPRRHRPSPAAQPRSPVRHGPVCVPSGLRTCGAARRCRHLAPSRHLRVALVASVLAMVSTGQQELRSTDHTWAQSATTVEAEMHPGDRIAFFPQDVRLTFEAALAAPPSHKAPPIAQRGAPLGSFDRFSASGDPAVQPGELARARRLWMLFDEARGAPAPLLPAGFTVVETWHYGSVTMRLLEHS